MSIAETTTRFRQRQPAQRQRHEHRRARRRDPARVREVGVDLVDEPRIAQAEVVVGDTAAAGQQVERELRSRLIDVAAEPLEPLERGLRGALGALDDRPALSLIGADRLSNRARRRAQRPRERDRILHRELRPRPDREMGGVRRVADEHDVARAPAVVADRVERQPLGVVLEQLMAAERVGEQLAAERDSPGIDSRQVRRPDRAQAQPPARHPDGPRR